MTERISFLGLTAEDVGVVATWAPVCRKVLPKVSEAFYAAVMRASGARRVLEQHTTVDRQRPVIERYLGTLFEGRIDDDWLKFRVHVGKRHDAINLDSMYYFGGYEILRHGFTDAVAQSATDAELMRFRDSFIRLLYFDSAVTLNALMDSRLARNEELAAKQLETSNAFVSKVSEAVQRVADSDLTARVEMTGDPGFDKIAHLFNDALGGICGSLKQVSEAASQVATAASEVTVGSQSSAQTASSQAGKLEEISASLQEITDASKQVSSSALEGQKRATDATSRAAEGIQAIQRLADAVSRIKQSSDETTRILKTIDEIAFQTNLLALNAAVEAARAGDAGKGFAVVAEEVRNLAIRSADAARSTAHLIEEGRKSAEGGVLAQGSVSTSLEAINDGVRSVQDLMEAISQASVSQSRMVEQIARAVDDLARGTQHSAATAEESASAAEELSGQAAALQDTVSTFRLGDDAPMWKPPAKHRAAFRRAG
ncbi:MAG: globin-coupled sensor protein [Myxococcales bacterium]|nr:globin-coupled sensor protein [Myxococcales bacterium]